ncbi:hypothetical protein TRFO_23048 [Tritrichomonas foetus]|uniref:TPR Domain containing protein n=1 Tax=Tritrichomonas foetus TaxID=1144522 RepID=A0A1J4KFN5_9EUKA|nr:hypothetical protein TRFO_23048 [Tritrichomonas foetus]|eukprot:OHT08446.1 hypothetical protein TRFO_23048 [Tritrichomonas foetus]
MALNLGLSVGETFGKAKVIGKPGIRVGGGNTNENSTSTNSQTNSTLSSLPKLENRLEEKAKRGDPRSQYELAMQLMEKPGQIKRVHDLLRSAAEKNHTKAMYQYALILATHKSKQKKAAEYMQIAASRNCPEANIALAIMLERGQGIEQNIKEALKIFKSYTKDPLALYHAGIIISQTDPKKGSAYFQRAAEKGHV